MRIAVSGLMLVLFAGCPEIDTGSAHVPGRLDDAADNVCTDVANCQVMFRYPAGSANSVELRGDFSKSGWVQGIPMKKNGGYFEAAVDLPDGRAVHYKFIVDGNWVSDPENADSTDSGDSVTYTTCDTCSATPYDWKNAIMYFVLVDRFFDGDPGNNQSVPGAPIQSDYRGGDFAGVLAKINEGYFDDLNVDVLWLTAPFDNADTAHVGDDGQMYSSYHGYWPSDLYKTEARWGSKADLKAVVDAAHARGMKVILDYVMNHVHSSSPVFAQHPDWFWPLEKPGGGKCVCGEACGWNGDEGRRCWFRDYLPDFDFTKAEVRNYSVDNAISWILDTGVDGYRLDAVKHIEDRWIRDLRERLRIEVEREGRTFYMVGETFDGSSELIGSYVDPETMLDGQFDFPLRAQLARVLLRRDGSMGDLADFLAKNDGFYAAGSIMGTFIGNHDLPRSIHIAEDAPQFGEWDSGKAKAWNNTPSLPTGQNPYERMALAYAFLMGSPGIPLIYYGDEYGMAGGGDPDNRRPMQWNGHNPHQTWLKSQITTLGKVRRDHAPLRLGKRTVLGSSQNALTFEMKHAGERVVVVLNRGDSAENAPSLPAGNYKDLLSGASVKTPVSVGARGYRFLRAE